MAGNLFETVKQAVTVKEAAQLYGIEVKRGGMACCPFHDDKNPSMKLNEDYFYCFGCGASGDVIDLTARFYNLSPKEAAEKLAQDFGLIYDSQAPPRRNYVRQKTQRQKFKEDRDHTFRVLADYFHLLRKWETDYSPKTPEESLHPRFLEAIQKKDYVGYLLDFFLENSPEEQKLWITEHQSEIANLERRVNIMAEKPTNRERLQQITAGIEQGIKELFESEKYMRYLSVMSKFHRYSVNNTMLIYMQKPDATLVAGFNKWKDQFERHVKKGEHGITIIAPTPYKKKIEEMKRDPDTHAPILDADGKAVMEEKEIEIPMFRPVKVFDVSQTDGKPLPELASSLSGNVQNYEVFMEAVRRSAPVPITFEPMAADMDGYFSSEEQKIAIRQGMSEVQTVSAAVHEVAHSKLHNRQKMQETAAAGDNTADQPKPKDRNTEEVEAESISYAVCQYFGIQTGENSFGYIASWSKDKELKELRASLETINKTSGELISDIDRHYKEICKERGIDPNTKQEPEQADIPQEALFLLDDATYLHVQPCDTGWDYTLYDKETMKELDGGQLDAPELSRSSAVRQICEGLELENPSIQDAPLSMIETLQDAAYQQMQEQVSQQTEDSANIPTQLPDAQEQALDEYPLPDPVLTQDDLEKCGYLDNDLLPLSKERAYELMELDLTVYIIQEGENPEMAFDTADLDAHDGIFAVSREEWEQSPQFHEKVLERQEHQQEREQAFLSHEGDCFAIYQVKHTDELRDIRYEGLDWLKSIGQTVQRDNYELVYTAPLQPGDLKGDTVEHLFYRFNNEHPADYQHPSMSVSDIVAIKQDGQVSCHYCDSFGFEQIPGFLPDNPLKNAEMVVEDDYGMIDGIINNGSREPTVAQLEQQARSGKPISLMDLAEAVHREERDKKKSVVEQLKSQPRTEHKKTAPKKSAEREL
ncbi:LPD16 domain-containing protein [Faecalibacterium prausnitzii]|uniref:Putative DNA primase n=1 Tax=Faecalibacterium prausnitzii M21/2 TaxID=411485 RepID=A8SHN8_9FIRM|nr:LPD16 domain-containing protein [Faecalibacterium prausnitzii]EDP20626.1 putative DNA primase [Faecalibacterium prausnitzii M21/2]